MSSEIVGKLSSLSQLCLLIFGLTGITKIIITNLTKESDMADKHNNLKQHWWRTVLSYLLILLASVSLISMITTRYVRDNIFSTDRYVEIITPLPQNPQVTNAVSTYLTDQLFGQANTQDLLNQFLPPKLSALAAPLSDTIKSRLTGIVSNFIQSDTFVQAWTEINRTAQSQLLSRIQQPPPQDSKLQQAVVKAGPVLAKIRERLGVDPILSDAQKDQLSEIPVNLNQTARQLNKVYNLINSSAHTLPFVFVGLILAAIAVAYNRRRAILVSGAFISFTAALMLIINKVLSNQALNSIKNSLYRQASSVIYEAFYSNLRARIVVALFVGLAIILLALLFGPGKSSRQIQQALRINRFPKTKLYQWALEVRKFALQWRLWLFLAGVIVLLIILLLAQKLFISNIVIGLALLVSYLSIVQLIAKPSPNTL